MLNIMQKIGLLVQKVIVKQNNAKNVRLFLFISE